MLLEIFVPAAVIILPILIPLNATNPKKVGVKGLDELGWQNYDPAQTSRFWAHLILAILFLFWVFFVVRKELRGYIRVRQSYLTSPQHRLRASATTVLITSIPRKWLTYEALNGLYDVMPGGIRNIWINRDFDELDQKIQQRDMFAKKLESAETNLIRNAKRKQLEREAKAEKARKKGKSVPDLEKRTATESDVTRTELHTTATPALGTAPASNDADLDDPSATKARIQEGKGHIGETVPRVDISRMNTSETSAVAGAENDFGKIQARVSDEFRGHSADDAAPLEPQIENETSKPTGRRKPGQKAITINEPQPLQRDLPSFDITTPTSTVAASETPITNRDAQDNEEDVHHWAQANAVPQRGRNFKFWKTDSHNIRVPSPEPHKRVPDNAAHDASALVQAGDVEKRTVVENKEVASSKLLGLITNKNSKAIQDDDAEYPVASYDEYADDQGFKDQPLWKKYLDVSDRDTTRLPLWGQSWLPYMPSWTFIGTKVDVIYHCRKELARLNLEIEQDQQVETFETAIVRFLATNYTSGT